MEIINGKPSLSNEEIEQRKKGILRDGITEDTVVYRIFSAERFFQTWYDKELTFVDPLLWDDPYENIFSNVFATDRSGAVISFANWVKNIYCQCWTVSCESDALWRIYSQDKCGIKVKTTVGKLFHQFHKYLYRDDYIYNNNFDNIISAGKVDYINESEIEKMISDTTSNLLNFAYHRQLDTLFVKRKPFDHEKELRFLIKRNSEKGNIAKFKINPIELFDEIVFDPRMQETNVKAFTTGFRNDGYEKPIYQSKLYYKKQFMVSPEHFNSYWDNNSTYPPIPTDA